MASEDCDLVKEGLLTLNGLNGSLEDCHLLSKYVDDIINDPKLTNRTYYSPVDSVPLIFAYSVLSIIAIFGNTIVCYVIFKNKRLHTATNFFLANMAVSDLLVTCINVPLNIFMRIMLDWPFGQAMCHLGPFSLMVSTYVSTYTLTAIAIDRHRVVLKPLSQRMSKSLAAVLLVLIWALALGLSLPFGIYTNVEKADFVLLATDSEGRSTLSYSGVRRCRTNYPPPDHSLFEQYLTVVTFLLQYCVPLSLIGVAYGRIVQSLWYRTHVGAVTATQQLSQAKAKRKSIKLLIAVVIVFAICWIPLNLYHLLTDLHPRPEIIKYDSRAYYACHWIAISSTCYNPFVYCWLNENFREEVKARFRWCLCCPLFRNRWCQAAVGLDKGAKRRRQDLLGDRNSAMTSSSRVTSVRREWTVTSDQDDLLHSSLQKQSSDGYQTDESGSRGEEYEPLALHRNGRMEYHVTLLHNCTGSALNTHLNN